MATPSGYIVFHADKFIRKISDLTKVSDIVTPIRMSGPLNERWLSILRCFSVILLARIPGVAGHSFQNGTVMFL